MKNLLILIAILLILPEAFARGQKLECRSETKIDGWDGGLLHDYLYLHAGVVGSNLLEPQTSGAFIADHPGEMTGKVVGSPKWLRFKFLEDAWCWYTVVLPDGFETKRGRFQGFVDRICEDGFGRMSVRMSCEVR
jgi:hypothetical protein